MKTPYDRPENTRGFFVVKLITESSHKLSCLPSGIFKRSRVFDKRDNRADIIRIFYIPSTLRSDRISRNKIFQINYGIAPFLGPCYYSPNVFF